MSHAVFLYNLLKVIKAQNKKHNEKLNTLLDGYLDSTIESETYKSKKNELFEGKIKFQEEIVKLQILGSTWLGPMREFINVAKDSQKIARAKNNCEELAFFAKRVGSNFFLKNRHLTASYKKGFDTLLTELSRPSPSRALYAQSLCERDTRIELAFHPWEGCILPLY